MPTFPSQLSPLALLPPPWEVTEVLPARPSSPRQVCLQLSGAGPRGSLASALLPFLKEPDKSSPVRQGEGVPLVKHLLTGLGGEAVAMCERKVFCFGRSVQQGCMNGVRHHPDQIRFDRSGVNKPPSTPLPLTHPEMFSFPLKTVSVY